MAEKQRRDQWIAEKTKAIKEMTVKGLVRCARRRAPPVSLTRMPGAYTAAQEPEIQRLVCARPAGRWLRVVGHSRRARS